MPPVTPPCRFKKDNTVSQENQSNPYSIDNREGSSRFERPARPSFRTTLSGLRRNHSAFTSYRRPNNRLANYYAKLPRRRNIKKRVPRDLLHTYPQVKRLKGKTDTNIFKKDNTKKFDKTRFTLVRRKSDPGNFNVVSQSNEIRRQAIKRSIKSIYRIERKRSMRNSGSLTDVQANKTSGSQQPSSSKSTVSQNLQKKLCLFYTRFGRCSRKESCPFIHDPFKVAVCSRFLRGTCKEDKCLFSHKCQPDKLPVCEYYLRGVCSRLPCPYRHVNVGSNAPICQDFVRLGHCSRENCPHHHLMICPEFAKEGLCQKKKCSLRHSRLFGTVFGPSKNRSNDDVEESTIQVINNTKPQETKDFVPLLISSEDESSEEDNNEEPITTDVQRYFKCTN
jgi:hypothetical protein